MSNEEDRFESQHREGVDLESDSSAEELTIEDYDGRLAQHLKLGALESPTTAESPSAARAKVLVISGSDEGRKFDLTGTVVTVGRGMDNDVVLTDLAVSRRHLNIERDKQSYFIQDLSSGNGTLLNGRDEDGRALLRHGDRLELGNTVIRFECPRPTQGYVVQGRRNPTERPPLPPPSPIGGQPAGQPAGRRRQAAATTIPPIPGATHSPDDVETRGANPLAPRPMVPQAENAPPPRQPGPSRAPVPGQQTSPAGPSGPSGPIAPIAKPNPMAGSGPPNVDNPLGLGSAPPQGMPMDAAAGHPGGAQVPFVPAYPQAPANYGSMNAVSAMRPRSHSQSHFGDAALPEKSSKPWLKPVVAAAAAGVIGVAAYALYARTSSGPVVAEAPTVEVVAVTPDKSTAPKPDDKPGAQPPVAALLTGSRSASELPLAVWGTEEGAATLPTTTTSPPNLLRPTTAPPTTDQPAEPPTPTGDARQERANAHYVAKEFSAAAALLREAAVGAEAEAAEDLTTRADRLGELDGALRSAQAALEKEDHATALRGFLAARATDKRLGAAHKSEFSSQVELTAGRAAEDYLRAGKLTRAKKVAAYAASDKKRTILAAIRRKRPARERPTVRERPTRPATRDSTEPRADKSAQAKKLFALGRKKAQRARSSADRKKAVTILKKARSLAGSNSSIGRKASALISDIAN